MVEGETLIVVMPAVIINGYMIMIKLMKWFLYVKRLSAIAGGMGVALQSAVDNATVELE